MASLILEKANRAYFLPPALKQIMYGLPNVSVETCMHDVNMGALRNA